jgi:hypothetical protein
LSRGAAIAFYAATSLAPVLLIVVAIAGLVFGQDAARTAITEELGRLAGPAGGDFIKSILERSSNPASGALATILGVLTVLITASGVFGDCPPPVGFPQLRWIGRERLIRDHEPSRLHLAVAHQSRVGNDTVAGWRRSDPREADAIAFVYADDRNGLAVEAAIPEGRSERSLDAPPASEVISNTEPNWFFHLPSQDIVFPL